jgi:drug/metabolite transporter (DMT)-like permease
MNNIFKPIGQRFRGELVLLWVTLVWGTTFSLVKDVLLLWPPFMLMTVRFGLAALVFLPWVVRHWRQSRETVLHGLILGGILFSGFGLQTLGLVHTSASRSAFFTALSVLLVPFLGRLFFALPIRSGTLLGVAFGGLGIMFLLAQGLEPEVLQGDYLTLFCALAFAAQILFLSEKCRQDHLLVLIGVEMCTVTLLSLGFALFWQESIPTSGGTLGELLFLGLIATALTLLAQIYGQRYTSATRAAFCFAFEPVFACLFAWFWSGQSLSGLEWLGAGCIFVAVLLSERSFALAVDRDS